MNRKRVRQAVLCLTLAMLAFGLGACGEDAPPAPTPVAPAPPPPFQPQAVEVELGASGTTVTLMTTEQGGFTLEGEAFEGGDLTAENGNMYTLSMSDGTWMAMFKPVVVEVMLGASGDMLTITMLEDRSYEAGGEPLMDGDMRTAMNGNMYSLSMMDGAWMAMYEPMMVTVDLGTSGASLTLSRSEDGMYTVADGMMVASVSTGPDGMPMGALAENGNMYMLSMNDDGMWMAMYEPPAPQMVSLGTSGDSVSVQMQEDHSFSIVGMDGMMMMIMDGHSVMAANGNEYMLSMMEGMWMASYMPSEHMVTLGMSGDMITLVRAEDHTYWLGDMHVMDGTMTMSQNGNTYSLSMMDGMWMATWVQDDPVMHMLGTSGASISLQRLEDRSWVRVGASGIAMLNADDANGMIMVTASNGNVYHLMLMADGEYGEAMFQAPAPVMVALGMSGESVSLQMAEDGSYWLGDMHVMDGSTVMSSDGRMYMLSMANGMWMASFESPMVTVMLGNSGQTAMLMKAEDGSYWLGDMAVMSGQTTTMTSDGRMYRLSMGEDGMWMGTYVPMTQTVAVGNSGIDITVVQDEAGQWSFTNPLTGEAVPLTSGMTYMVGMRTYMASMGEDGMWMATYVAREVMVPLGMSGEMVTLVVAEDGSYWLGADMVVSGQTMATTSAGVMYMLSMGEDGMWMAAPTGNQVTVMLGISGTATLMQSEDGTWRHGMDLVNDGSVISAPNGNMYRLMMGEDGMWMATYVPMEMAVMGTPLVALANEDGSGYMVDGAMLPSSGMGDITTSMGAMYRIHMEDAMLHGARYDVNQHGDTDDRWLGFGSRVDFIADDLTTMPNEANTMLQVNGRNFPVSELLDAGTSTVMGPNFVAQALETLTALHMRALAFEELNDSLGVSNFDDNIIFQWTGDPTQNAINTIFGRTGTDPNFDLHRDGTDTVTAAQALENLGDLITALTSAEAFAEATADEGDGVMERAGLSAEQAMSYFDAVRDESMTFYRTTEHTRYGAGWTKIRNTANQDLMFRDSTTNNEDVGQHGTFWWGLIPDTIHRSHLPAAGTLHYTGGTLAVGIGDDMRTPTLYEGTIDVTLSLTRSNISAIVSDLRDMDQNPLVINFAEVDHIVLPQVRTLPDTLVWGDGANNSVASGGLGESVASGVAFPARVFYRAAQGISAGTQDFVGAWRGMILGTGSDLATAVVGDWWIGQQNAHLLTGSYGAERVERPEPPAPTLPPLDEAATVMFETHFSGTEPEPLDAMIEDGNLIVTVDANTNPNEDESHQYAIAISSLTQGGQKTINGNTWIPELRDYIATQRRVLNGWINLNAGGGNNQDTNYGRSLVWAAIRDRVLDNVFGELATDDSRRTANLMAATYPGTGAGCTDGNSGNCNTSAADDAAGMAFLDELEAALGSAAGWDAARHEGGIFWDDDNDRTYQACNNDSCTALNKDLEAGSAVFSRRQERLHVGFDTTDYTRFGFWRRSSTTYAARGGYTNDTTNAGPAANRNNGFAFSPLAPATYAQNTDPINDPLYPVGTATYVGKTIANQNTTRWLGDVTLTVDWDMSRITLSDLTVVMSNLMNPDGLPLQYDSQVVRDIIFFRPDGNNVTYGDDSNEVGFTTTAVRLRFQDRSTPTQEIADAATLNGSFVGRGVLGPVAAIGTWRIAGASDGINNNGNPIVGGFGVDLVGGP